MEKKGTRNLPTLRGTATDSKKDGINSKLWPRGSRRREVAGSSLSTKNEPSHKPQPQRVKTFDKRPKPRGSYYTGAMARNEETEVEEHSAELGSVFLPGSKKQSLNHLLNFSYTPRDSYQTQRVFKDGCKGSNSMLTTKKHKYNKEHFLQANCQFVVNESGNYKQYLNNPDDLVDWNLVEQVNIQVSEFPTCPICLYSPVAAKMTRCGHIYCWSCVLHFLSLSEKPTRKCPICFEPLYKSDLKSVVALPYSTFNVTETITFKLMKRLKGSLIAYPIDADVKEGDVIFNMSEKNVQDVYSKLLLAKKEDILLICSREYNELTKQLAEECDSTERCFIEEAITLLQEREVVLGSGSCCDSLVGALTGLNIADKSNELSVKTENSTGISGTQPSRYHYFYQASDGQHLYLHAINARMLEHTYGSLEFGPKTLTGRILEKEGGSMTEDLRKRLRYLQHLPVTCQFEVAEIQLKQPVVNKETMEYFQEQIEIRRKRRQRRMKEEKRREKRIEVEENRKMGKYPIPNLHLESNIQFPEFCSESRIRTESESTLLSEQSASPDTSLNASIDCAYTGPSFATIMGDQVKRRKNLNRRCYSQPQFRVEIEIFFSIHTM
ncbi:E3 ubiquitin-protein ligase RNF10 isoform X2 [Leptinotarsa decemlineata]|uniref:E3 ubiquitin-protein ligase RNF10 isoform X2 n=1 Tax=Leptinotarsa decemlineata TaxID=7539 RepID=UPI003D30A461